MRASEAKLMGALGLEDRSPTSCGSQVYREKGSEGLGDVAKTQSRGPALPHSDSLLGQWQVWARGSRWPGVGSCAQVHVLSLPLR